MGWIFAIVFLLSLCIVTYLWFELRIERDAIRRERDEQATKISQLEAEFTAKAAAQHGELAALLSQLDAERCSKAALQAERDKLAAAYSALRKRMQGILDADAEHARVLAETKQTAEKFNAELAVARAKFKSEKQRRADELASLEAQLVPLRKEHRELSEEAALLEMGFYKSHYGFASSERYKKAISENTKRQREMLSDKIAAICSMTWTIEGSAEKGRKHVEKTLSLMLRAFNGECDSAISKVKATNFQTMENRIQKSFEAINKLGSLQGCRLSDEFRALRIEELRLEHEHALKIQVEREEQRAIREEMRQQAIAQRELERAQEEAEREERQYETALEKARQDFERASAAKQEEMRARLAELEQLVAEAHANKERAISRAQQTRSGHVYVISNIGSFGTHVYKIGMTRRLDPMDRIWELSDASVPFDFDVHAIIYTEDAPGLETELHQRFGDRRINVVNQRKEFFHVTIDEIATVVRERCGDIELTLAAEAAEFLQSEAYRRENGSHALINRVFGYLPESQPQTA